MMIALRINGPDSYHQIKIFMNEVGRVKGNNNISV